MTVKFSHVDPATGKVWSRPALYEAMEAAKAEAEAIRLELQATQGKEPALIPWTRYQADLVARRRIVQKEAGLLVRDIRWAFDWARRQVNEVKLRFH